MSRVPVAQKDLEIRQNKVTREWVIYAPRRSKRPRDFQRLRHPGRDLPARDDNCPFCPGNEEHLDEIILELPGPETGPWHTRVVPNKFPALAPGVTVTRQRSDIYVTMPGYGKHEVVIESPLHSHQIAAMSQAETAVIVETYHRRYVDLMGVHENMMAIIFRNHGEGAGTSLAHPHSQIIVTGIVPNHIRWREEVAQRHFDDWGRCLFCEILESEVRRRDRVLLENDSFVGFVPFAADVPFEVWLMPKRHQADFGNISDREKSGLASALREVLSRLYRRLNDPDYNYVINTAARYRSEEPQLHWYLQVRPRLTTQAGFEIGSGISINPSLPEDDARLLNQESGPPSAPPTGAEPAT